MKGTGACVLVDEAGSCLSDGLDCIQWFVYELIMVLGSLSVNGGGCVPILLVVWHGVSSTGVCWWLSGAGSLH